MVICHPTSPTANVSALPGETWTPKIVSFQSCKRLEDDTVLACYIFHTHQSILIIFVDNKVVLLSTVCKLQILFLAWRELFRGLAYCGSYPCSSAPIPERHIRVQGRVLTALPWQNCAPTDGLGWVQVLWRTTTPRPQLELHSLHDDHSLHPPSTDTRHSRGDTWRIRPNHTTITSASSVVSPRLQNGSIPSRCFDSHDLSPDLT